MLQALPHIDNPWKALSLAFFTTMLTFMNFMALVATLRVGPLVQIFFLGLAALTLFSPTVRRSRLVRTGTGLVVLGVVPLMIAGILRQQPARVRVSLCVSDTRRRAPDRQRRNRRARGAASRRIAVSPRPLTPGDLFSATPEANDHGDIQHQDQEAERPMVTGTPVGTSSGGAVDRVT